jgi:hypothetical protein
VLQVVKRMCLDAWMVITCAHDISITDVHMSAHVLQVVKGMVLKRGAEGKSRAALGYQR